MGLTIYLTHLLTERIMNQDQLNGIAGAVVQAVVKTLVEQITPIVVEYVKNEVAAGMNGVLAMDEDVLAKPVLRLMQNDVAIVDEIDERIDNVFSTHKRDIEYLYESLARRVGNIEFEHVALQSDEFKLAVRAVLRDVL
jgi:hypothetical protein